MRRILIIKTGATELLEGLGPGGSTVSLGDVLRTTPLLHRFTKDAVTWMVDPRAEPLLRGNPLIDRVITSAENLVPPYDLVVNLEKSPEMCALARAIPGRRAGFICGDEMVPREGCFQETLFRFLGMRWRREGYVMPRLDPVRMTADVGLNHLVGSKWPTKAWPRPLWQELSFRLPGTVSWQKGEKDLETYIRWIQSVRSLITCDSLGLHLAIGMGKPVVALFGPTPADEVYLYGRGVKLTSRNGCPDRPCFGSRCSWPEGPCMSCIPVDEVLECYQRFISPSVTTTSAVS